MTHTGTGRNTRQDRARWLKQAAHISSSLQALQACRARPKLSHTLATCTATSAMHLWQSHPLSDGLAMSCCPNLCIIQCLARGHAGAGGCMPRAAVWHPQGVATWPTPGPLWQRVAWPALLLRLHHACCLQSFRSRSGAGQDATDLKVHDPEGHYMLAPPWRAQPTAWHLHCCPWGHIPH
jgi:hypothetical protein